MSKYNSGVYRIEIGENYYIGKTSDLRTRKQSHTYHLRHGSHRNQHMQRSYDKYGSFVFRTLVYCEGDCMSQLEASLIKQHIDDARCMNLVLEDGCGVRSHSEESRQKISLARQGKVVSDETKKRLSESLAGRVFTEEHRRKIAAASRGRTHTAEARRKLSLAGTGRKHSEETKARIRLANKLIKKKPEQYASVRKCVVIVAPCGEFYFPSLQIASKYTGMQRANLGARLAGRMPWPTRKSNQYAGWTGHYIDKEADSGN